MMSVLSAILGKVLGKVFKFLGGVIANVISVALTTPAKEVDIENTGNKDMEATANGTLRKQYNNWMYNRHQRKS